MTQKRWKLVPPVAQEDVEQLASAIHVNPYLAQILVQRGIKSFDAAKAFFRPSWEHLHDPLAMKGMDKALEKLHEIMENKGMIRFYGDYDVDGTTSVSMMWYHFKQHLAYENVDVYIPDRYKEGYGISMQGIDHALDSGVELMVALDCGIKAKKELTYAAMKGLPVIVCDHHNPGEHLPPALAILNPKQSDCSYPFKELSGCGVGFKLLTALNQSFGLAQTGLREALQFVAVSTCADIVEMQGENRTLTSLGLAELNQSPLPGFRALMNEYPNISQWRVSDVVFQIAPKINAAGRMAHGFGAVQLLCSEEVDEETLTRTKEILEQNKDRQSLDKSITEEALQLLESPEEQKKLSTVVAGEDWHKGVVGIVASRLIEKVYRPTVVLTKHNHKLTGSARSVEGFDLYAALSTCSDLFESFGGHRHAAGLTFDPKHLEEFKLRFEEAVAHSWPEENRLATQHIDLESPPQHWNGKSFAVLDQMEPFGPKNLRPVFKSGPQKAYPNSARILKEQHLKFVLEHPNADGEFLEAIAFGFGHLEPALNKGATFEMAYSLEQNEWNGQKRLQIFVKDVVLLTN